MQACDGANALGTHHDCQWGSDTARSVPVLGGGVNSHLGSVAKRGRQIWDSRQTNFEPDFTSCGGIETAALSALRMRPLDVLHSTASERVANEGGMPASTDRIWGSAARAVPSTTSMMESPRRLGREGAA
jgi:hypothetical protein